MLEPSDHIVYEKEGDNYALVIKGVELKEAGKYTVKATNEVGSLSAKAKLKVKGKCILRIFNSGEHFGFFLI